MISALFGWLVFFSNDPFVFPAVLGILNASPVVFAQKNVRKSRLESIDLLKVETMVNSEVIV